MALMLFHGTFIGFYIASVYKVIAQGSLSDRSLTIAGAIGSACNGTSRLVWGALQDKFGFKSVYSCMMFI